MTRCKSCGARILWVRMEKTGKPAPLDFAPNPKGTVRIWPATTGGFLAEVVKPKTHPVLRLSHFATCPDAAKHRKQEELKL